jgi:hypothetical protein
MSVEQRAAEAAAANAHRERVCDELAATRRLLTVMQLRGTAPPHVSHAPSTTDVSHMAPLFSASASAAAVYASSVAATASYEALSVVSQRSSHSSAQSDSMIARLRARAADIDTLLSSKHAAHSALVGV